MSEPDARTFCELPFTHIDVRLRGRFGTCCRSTVETRVPSFAGDEPWNGEDFRRIRRQLWNGEKAPECETCWKLEDAGAMSYRQESLQDQSPTREWRDNIKAFDPQTGRVGAGIPMIEVNFSNVCNLQCRMCNPEYSSRWEKDWREKSTWKTWFEKNDSLNPAYEFPSFDQRALAKNVVAFLREQAPHLRYLKIVGGEPLLQHEHYAALEELKPFAHDIVLEYSTNLSVLGLGKHSVFDLWRHFKRVNLVISIDGPPDLYRYIRRGADVAALESNLIKVHEFIREHGLENRVGLTGSATFSAYNVGKIVETARYISELGLRFHSSQVEFPSFLSSQILPPRVKGRIAARFERELARLEREWTSDPRKELQLEKIRTYGRNAILHMQGADRSEEFAKFLSFDREFNRGSEARESLFLVSRDWWPELLRERLRQALI